MRLTLRPLRPDQATVQRQPGPLECGRDGFHSIKSEVFTRTLIAMREPTLRFKGESS